MPNRVFSERHPRAVALLAAVVLVLLAVLAATPPAGATVCSRGNVPAATLLVPYFEVDLAAPGGETTLFSIGNTAAHPTLAKVVVWTDWGFPVLDFFVHLGPDAVQTINLRDVVGGLRVPPLTGVDPLLFPGCHAPQPPVVGPTVEEVQAKLTGRPDGAHRCHGSPRGDTTLAVGFVTVDVVRDCDLLVGGATPLDAEYVDLAEDDDVLFGDVFYVDPDDDSAQGLAAVSVRSGLPSFGDPFYPQPIARVPTDEQWRARFLAGGAVGAETEVVIWLDVFLELEHPDGVACDVDPFASPFGLAYAVASGPEAGPLPEPPNPGAGAAHEAAEAVTRKLALSELVPGVLPSAGVLAIEGWRGCFDCPFIPGGTTRVSAVVFPIFRASGRFSVGVEATPIEGRCGSPSRRTR